MDRRRLPRTLALRHLAFPLLVACALCTAPAGRAAFVDYLYIEANAGGSSAGHVAIRFGDQVYHYQNDSFEILRMARDDYEDFRHLYSVLENRTIHIGRIETSDQTAARVRDRFNERYLVESAHLDALASLRRDLELLEWLKRGGDDAPPLAGVGFFARERAGTSSPTRERLAERARARYGDDALRRRIEALRAEVVALRPVPTDFASIRVSPDLFPPARYGFADRYQHVLTAIRALEVLRDVPPLDRRASFAPTGIEFALTPAELAGLKRYASSLEQDLLELLESRRSDWGFAFLLGLARLAVLDETLASGRLVLLDAFPADASRLPDSALRNREFADETFAELRSQFAAALFPLQAEEVIGERDYNLLEETGGRLFEFQRGIAENRPARVAGGVLVPSGPVAGMSSPRPAMNGERIERELAAVRSVEREYRRALRTAYAYRLVGSNCVSALLDTLHSAFPEEEIAVHLGGRLENGGAATVVPLLSFGAVNGTYRVREIGRVLSYRRARLAEMYERENPLLVYLRESNTLTSSVYRHNDGDPFFIFFTDAAAPLRPFYGAVNVLAGLGQAVAGIFLLPVDHGARLASGVKATLFSLPELAFVNIRKGSMTYGRRRGLTAYEPVERRYERTGSATATSLARAEKRSPVRSAP